LANFSIWRFNHESEMLLNVSKTVIPTKPGFTYSGNTDIQEVLAEI